MLVNWLRKWLRGETRSSRQQGQCKRGSRRASFQPGIEALEDRQLMSASAMLASAVNTYQGSYVVKAQGQLFEHIGPDSNTGWYPISTPAAVAQVSAGTVGNQDCVYARLINGDVYEYYGNPGSFQQALVCHNAAEISASQTGVFSTVYVRKTDKSVSEFQLFWGTSEIPQGAPPNIDPKSATQISAGLDGATHTPAVFVNFNGALYEHRGTSPTAGWSYVTGYVDGKAPPYGVFFEVTDFSASQVEGNKVFVVNFLGGLSEFQAPPSSGALQFNSTPTLLTGVSQVSAGVDDRGSAIAFALKTDGTLNEQTGWTSSSPWKEIDLGVTSLNASQGQLNTVVYSANHPYPNYSGGPDYSGEVMEYNWNAHDLIWGWN
jgi:hypothetical protein